MTEPLKIDDAAIFDTRALCLATGLTSSAVDQARKAGELPSVRRGTKRFYQGRDVRAWLAGETPALAVGPC